MPYYLNIVCLLALLTLPSSLLHAESDFDAATILYQRQRWAEAATVFGRIANQSSEQPTRLSASFFAAESLLQAKDYSAAATAFLRLAEQDHDNPFQAKSLLRAGEAQLLQGDIASAKQNLLTYAATFPHEAERWRTYKLLADVALQEQDDDSAIALSSRVIDSSGDASLVNPARVCLAQALLNEERPREVVTALGDLLDSSDPQWSSAALMLKGRAEYESGLYSDALSSFRQVTALEISGRKSAGAHLAAGWALWKLDRCEEIPQEVESAMQDDEFRLQAEYLAGMTDYRCKQWSAALERLKTAAEDLDAPHYSATLFYCGECLLRMQHSSEAAKWFLRVAEECQDSAWTDDAWWGVIRVATLLRDDQLFATAAGNLTEHFPLSPYARQLETAVEDHFIVGELTWEDTPDSLAFEEAIGLERDGFFDGALASYRAFLLANPDSSLCVEAMWRKACLEQRNSKRRLAVESLETLRKAYPAFDRMPQLLLNLADLYDQEGNTQQSFGIRGLLLEKFPHSTQSVRAAYCLAMQSADENDSNTAEQYLDKALGVLFGLDEGREEPLRKEVLCLYCQLLAKRHAWTELSTLLKESNDGLEQDHLSARLKYWEAEAAFRTGHYEAAQQMFADLILPTAALYEAWVPMVDLRLAQIAGRFQMWDLVLEHTTRLAGRFPEFEYMYECDYLAGRALAGNGEYTSAREAYRRVLDNGLAAGTETQVMAQWMIGETYFHQRNYALAEAAYNKVIAQRRYPEWRARGALQAGKCAELQEDWQRAYEIYAEALSEQEASEVQSALEARFRWTTQRIAQRDETLVR